jgi:hypothetical protein
MSKLQETMLKKGVVSMPSYIEELKSLSKLSSSLWRSLSDQ